MSISNVKDAIVYLNNHFGRGDVRNVKVFLDGRIEFTRQPFGMKPEVRRGRMKNDTVYALGHQITIRK